MGFMERITNAVRALMGTSTRSTSLENPTNTIWDSLGDLNNTSDSGEAVTPRRAMGIPALYQGVTKISGDVAKLPLAIYERSPDGGRRLMREHHAFRYVNLIGQANEEINAFKFWRRLMVQSLIYNNGYAWIDKNGRGEVLGLYNLLSDRTTPRRRGGRLQYVTEVGGKLVALEPDEVLHIEGPSLDCLAGANMLTLFRDLIGQSLAKRKFGSRFFKNSMTAGGVLAVPPGAKPEAVRKVQAGLKEKFSSTDNAFKTLVLRDGYKWFSTMVDPQKAQLVEWTEQDAREIARLLNIRAGILSVEGSTSYNASEMDLRDYHDSTLSHWLIGIRSECNAKLRTPQEITEDSTYFDYNINALMWADSATRANIANSGIANGRFSPNETRGWENLNPYEGGDQFFRPLNLEPVGTSSQDEAARALAQATLTRARNRWATKLERCKTDADRQALLADAGEQATLREMIQPAATILRQQVPEVLAAICVIGESGNGT
jgi:HK97 family phage portal protein